MFLHANAVAENCSARVGAGWVDRDNSHGAFVFAIEAGQLIDQRALARARWPGQPEHARLAAVRKQGFQQLGPSGRAVLDHRDGASQCTNVAGAELLDPKLVVVWQTAQCKAVGGKRKLGKIEKQSL